LPQRSAQQSSPVSQSCKRAIGKQKLPRLLAAAKSAGTVEVEAGSRIDMWSNEASEGKFDLKTGISSRDAIKTRLNDLKSEVAQLGWEPQYIKRDKAGTRSRITHGASSSRFVYSKMLPSTRKRGASLPRHRLPSRKSAFGGSNNGLRAVGSVRTLTLNRGIGAARRYTNECPLTWEPLQTAMVK
jgi:hypothetical protein